MIPKFRAWVKPGVLSNHPNGVVADAKPDFLGMNCLVKRDDLKGKECFTEIIDFEDIELMQSTGLKDKNGVEIFEGDIVHRKVHLVLFGSDLNKWIDEYACVEWKYGGWHVGEDLLDLILDEGVDRHTLCRQTAIEIAGNIHEDKELLEVEG